MCRKCIPIIALLIIIGLTPHISGGGGPLIPPPVFTSAGIQSSVAYESTTGLYTYSYTITNPSTNTGEIWSIDIDITKPPDSVYLSSEGLTIPYGVRVRTFDELAARRDKPMVPVGILVPSSVEWGGSLTNSGTAGFSTGAGSGPGGSHINPGETKGGFELISRGLPTIRQIEIEPWWIMVEEGPASEEGADIARSIEESLIFHTKTLGPTALPRFLDPKDFLNTVRSYIDESVQLGWLMDAALTTALKSQLDRAYAFVDANDPSSAKLALQEFMTAVEQASSTQRTSEAKDLLYFNAKYLKDWLPDTYIPQVRKLNLTPSESSLTIGTIHTLTATYMEDNIPVPLSPYCRVTLKVTTGPNAGLSLTKPLNTNGNVIFSYTSATVGTDQLEAEIQEIPDRCDVGITSIPVQVIWNGGPDLAIELFVPPYVKGQGGTLVDTIEITGNYGSTSSNPSITRYYLSIDDDTIDPNQDIPVGEHAIPPLEPMKLSDKYSTAIQLPSDLTEGKYYLGACADAAQSVAELNEENNCEVNQLIVVFEGSANQPPDCTKATPSLANLWPPNHKLVIISIGEVTDPDGDSVALTVTRITQDEPVNGLGDGDTSPDGFITAGNAQIMLRAERSGKGNGRVYAISFNAKDGKGGSCTGTVTVGVPHDQGKGSTPIDDGQNYDSTLL